MKKKILISLLVVSFFNYIGCASSLNSTDYFVLSEEEISEGRPEPDESIKLILHDGKEIECVPISEPDSGLLYYVKVDTPNTSIMGRGKILNLITGVTSDFNGVISEDIIDSSRILITNSIEKYFLWTINKDCVYFESGYYLKILTEAGTGYFLWKPNEMERKISFSEIEETQVSHTNWYVVGPAIAIIVAAIVGFAFIIDEMNKDFN